MIIKINIWLIRLNKKL